MESRLAVWIAVWEPVPASVDEVSGVFFRQFLVQFQFGSQCW